MLRYQREFEDCYKLAENKKLKKEEIESKQFNVFCSEASSFLTKYGADNIINYLYGGIRFTYVKKDYWDFSWRDYDHEYPLKKSTKSNESKHWATGTGYSAEEDTPENNEELEFNQSEEVAFQSTEEDMKKLAALFEENAKNYFDWLKEYRSIEISHSDALKKIADFRTLLITEFAKELIRILKTTISYNLPYWEERARMCIGLAERIDFMDRVIKYSATDTEKMGRIFTVCKEKQKNDNKMKGKEDTLFSRKAHEDVVKFTNLYIKIYEDFYAYIYDGKSIFNLQNFEDEFNNFFEVNKANVSYKKNIFEL